jgi:hypothetical protein
MTEACLYCVEATCAHLHSKNAGCLDGQAAITTTSKVIGLSWPMGGRHAQVIGPWGNGRRGRIATDTCTLDLQVVYFQADAYPASPAMLMCDDDQQLNGQLHGLNDQYEEYAVLSDVLRAVCTALKLGECRQAHDPEPFPEHGTLHTDNLPATYSELVLSVPSQEDPRGKEQRC